MARKYTAEECRKLMLEEMERAGLIVEPIEDGGYRVNLPGQNAMAHGWATVRFYADRGARISCHLPVPALHDGKWTLLEAINEVNANSAGGATLSLNTWTMAWQGWVLQKECLREMAGCSRTAARKVALDVCWMVYSIRDTMAILARSAPEFFTEEALAEAEKSLEPLPEEDFPLVPDDDFDDIEEY